MVEVDWVTVNSNVKFLLKLTYWAVGFIIALTISYVLFTRFNKQVASLLVFIATMLALYYYYVKWIVIGNTIDIPVSFCPDFMTSTGTPYNDGTNNHIVCYDTTGLYQPTLSASTGAQPTGVVTLTNGYAITNTHIIMPGSDAAKDVRDDFCRKLADKNISWIYGCKTLNEQASPA